MTRRPELTEAQKEISLTGPKFADVRPDQIAGPTADGRLAQRIFLQNPQKYRDLVQEDLWATGQERRPDSFYE